MSFRSWSHRERVGSTVATTVKVTVLSVGGSFAVVVAAAAEDVILKIWFLKRRNLPAIDSAFATLRSKQQTR
jgi:hypothetical protein